MRKQFKVELCRPVFQQMTTMGVVAPKTLNNACMLLGINTKDLNKKNQFVLYFMVKEAMDNYERNLQPTELEVKQMEYVRQHMGDDLTHFISEIDGQITVNPDKAFDKTQLLDVLFSAADTDIPQSHDELPKNGELDLMGVSETEEYLLANSEEIEDEVRTITFNNEDETVITPDGVKHDLKKKITRKPRKSKKDVRKN